MRPSPARRRCCKPTPNKSLIRFKRTDSTSACRAESNSISTSCKPLTPPMPHSAARQFLSPRKQTDQFPAPKQKTNNSQPNHDHENVLSHSLVVSVRVFHRAQAHVAATTAASIGRRRHSLSRSPPRLSHRTLRRSK